MSIEVLLFIIVGGLSVAAAVLMLLSENAVHSALFLILNFICVAFLYVMLDASFLAVVQVAVYAGAIMVLFLFVIMLLGAEKVTKDAKQFKWMPWTALVLALVFLVTVSAALISGEIDEQEVPESDPQVRVIHVAPDVEYPLDIFFDGRTFANALDFANRGNGAAFMTDFAEVAPDEYAVGIHPTGPGPMLIYLADVTFEPGQAYTLILYGEGALQQELLPRLAVVEQDLSTIQRREGRVTVFNAYTGATVNLVDIGGDFKFDGEEDAAAAEVIAGDLEPGLASKTFLERAGSPTWAFVQADNVDEIVKRLHDLEIKRNTANLLILAGERNALDGTLDPVLIPVEDAADIRFGSPSDVGATLFIDYLLPFEMVAILLLAAMVGVIVLTQRGEVKPKPGRVLRHRVSRPLTSVIAAQIGQSVDEEDAG